MHLPTLLKSNLYKGYFKKNSTVFFIPISEETGMFQAITHNHYRLTAHPTDSLPNVLQPYLPLIQYINANNKFHAVFPKKILQQLTAFVMFMRPDNIVVKQDWNVADIKAVLKNLHYQSVYHHQYIVYQKNKVVA